MSIDVRWFGSNQNCLYYEIVGKWTWDDLYRAIAEGIRLSAAKEQPLYIIADMRRSQYVPMLTAEHLSKVATLSSDQNVGGGLILLGAGHFVRLMFDIFRRIHPLAAERYRFADTLEELDGLLEMAR
jgi:hypothetical protein